MFFISNYLSSGILQYKKSLLYFLEEEKNAQETETLQINESKQEEKQNTRRTAERWHPREAHAVVFWFLGVWRILDALSGKFEILLVSCSLLLSRES